MIIGIPYTNCEYVSDIPCTSEPEAVAIACGAWLGGDKPEVFMNDMGFCASLNVIGSLCMPYGITLPIRVKKNYKLEHHYWTSLICDALMQLDKSLKK